MAEVRHEVNLYLFKYAFINIEFVSLGRASIYILRTAFGVDWSERIKIIYAGDDATDEEAMLVRVICVAETQNFAILNSIVFVF